MLRVGVIAAALIAIAPLIPQARADSASDVIAMWDPDHDGTLDLAEINKAAAAEFDKLDLDHDGTLDMKELGQHVASAEFQAADQGRHARQGRICIDCSLRVHAANPDNDATIDAKELRTAASAPLMELLK
jgi:EF hand